MELYASFDEPDAMASLVSSVFLCSVSTLSNISKLQLLSDSDTIASLQGPDREVIPVSEVHELP